MGAIRIESKQLLKHLNIPQVIHTTPVHQLTYCESKLYVCIKPIHHKSFFSLTHNIALPSEHSMFCCPHRIIIHWHICLEESLLIQMRWLFKGEMNIMDTYLKCLDGVLVLFKHLFLLHKMLIDGLEWYGIIFDFVMFYQRVWTLILTAPIHYRGSFGEQVMQCLIPPNLFWWRNKPIYILNDLRVSNIKQIVSLRDYSFNKLKTYKQLKSAETNLPHLNHDIWSFWAAEIWLSVANDLQSAMEFLWTIWNDESGH